MCPTSAQSIVPGLLKRSLLRFERTTFHALAELLEDLGALAYHRYAVLDERCTWEDTRFDNSPAPQKGRGACRQHVSGDPTNGDVPAPPGVAHPPAAPAHAPMPNLVECPNGRDASPESHVACRGGGHATCRHDKLYFGLPLVDACPHDKAHVGPPFFAGCPHDKPYGGLPFSPTCPHDWPYGGLPLFAACPHDKPHGGLPLFGACFHEEARFGLPLYGVGPQGDAQFELSRSGVCLHRCHRG